MDDWADDNFDHAGLDFIGGGNLWVYSDRRPIAAASMTTFGKAPQWGSAWKAFVKQNADRWNMAYLQKTTLPYEDNYLDLDPTVKDPLGFPVCRITADFKDNERKVAAFIQDKMVEWFMAAGAVATEKGPDWHDGSHDACVRRYAHGRQPRHERRQSMGFLPRGSESGDSGSLGDGHERRAQPDAHGTGAGVADGGSPGEELEDDRVLENVFRRMSPPALLLEDVSRHFGGLKAVDNVSLTVAPGARHALIGPNGAGKTTLFNLISGELTVTTGRVMLFGSGRSNLPPHQRAALGLARTFQITKLFPGLTVFENMLLACEALDRRKLSMHRAVSSYSDLGQRANELIERFALSALSSETAANLSYGDQRKLEVALSMAGRPRLLLLDEPMAGLSAGESRTMHALLDQLDPAIAVLLIEHDMDVAFAFAERITVLHQGRVLTEGHKDEVSANGTVQQIYLGTTMD